MTDKICSKCNKKQKIECFSKHSGTKDKLDNRCKNCVKLVKKNRIENNIDSKEYNIYNFDIESTEWQVGKPIGSILERENNGALRFEVRIPLGNAKMKSKSFSHNKFDNVDTARKAAEEWLINYSKENNLTRNMIRVVDKDTIEVKLSKNLIMKTDIKFINICQSHILCAGKAGRDNADYYSLICINNKNLLFHKHITGNPMTDHINRDPMDNRMVNLRKTTPKLNNNNRSAPKKCKEYEFHELGVRYLHRDEAWQARIKQNGKEYTKSFSIKKYGYEESKHMAMDARKEFNIQFSCTNDK